jgi:hypothetical protein
MPPILLGAAGSMIAPAALILDFIPPSVDSIQKITDMLTNLPKIIVDGFTASAKGLPMLNFEVFGIKVSVGDVKLPEGSFKPDAIVNLIIGLITAPFNIFKGILESLIKLAPVFPTIDSIKKILGDSLAAVGIPADVAVKFTGCLATSFMEVIKAIIP